MKQPLIVLTGPTAVGKTSLSIQLAQALDGEIISADSMQVYHHMDIGSAKVTDQEMKGVPHHLIDILEPWEDFNVAIFQSMAKQALSDIYGRGHIPIVAGGTGFYIQALLYDIDFKKNESDSSVREELENIAQTQGNEYLHQLLTEADPDAAAQIHANNQKRVIRALEYYKLTGQRISEHNQQEREKESPYRFYYYVLNCDRARLYQRIDQRVDQMMDVGLVAEVEKLRDMGCCRGMTSMQGLGYKEILDYLNQECSLEEAVRVLKRDTRHFAKRQLTWFKREREVRWLQLEDFGCDPGLVLEHILEEFRQGEKTAKKNEQKESAFDEIGTDI